MNEVKKVIYAVKHNHMKESLLKYFTKTMLYQLVTRTEYGFIFEKVNYYIAIQFNLFKEALKEVSAVKHKLMKESLKKYLTKHICITS